MGADRLQAKLREWQQRLESAAKLRSLSRSHGAGASPWTGAASEVSTAPLGSGLGSCTGGAGSGAPGGAEGSGDSELSAAQASVVQAAIQAAALQDCSPQLAGDEEASPRIPAARPAAAAPARVLAPAASAAADSKAGRQPSRIKLLGLQAAAGRQQQQKLGWQQASRAAAPKYTPAGAGSSDSSSSGGSGGVSDGATRRQRSVRGTPARRGPPAVPSLMLRSPPSPLTAFASSPEKGAGAGAAGRGPPAGLEPLMLAMAAATTPRSVTDSP